MRALRRFFLLAALLGASAASAYVLCKDESDVYLIKWYRTPVVMHISLATTANLSDGSSFHSSVAAALQTWNAHLGVIQFASGAARTPSYTLGNEINEIALDDDVDGEAFPTDVLALTINHYYGDEIAESDIVFNDAYKWDSYRGGLRSEAADVRRVAVHELGHVLGLDHPDEHQQQVSAIMNSHVSSIETPRTDDLEGVRALYGTPGMTPANDHFANAIAITLSNGQAQVTGSNIGATRQAGESGHADATSVHSIWWTWTAPGDGTASADTLGSNFDTVLAAYTGSSVANLTTIAANDDEEMPDQNPAPQRKRTSKVSFAAIGGTTYRFAVDGWGDNDNSIPGGYTGAVTLNLRFSGQQAVAPVITRQPSSQSIAQGGTFNLSTTATSDPAPALQWRHNGRDITGAAGSTLLLANVQPANAGLYTAVSTSGVFATTSEPAIVGVTTTRKVIGAGEEIGANITHANGKVFDQVLATGAAEAITADHAFGQITRTSFIDLDGDIVQVEFSGPGTLSLVLDGATGRAEPEKYNQPGVLYVTGHAGIVIVGATEQTNVSVFSVGRITAINQALFMDEVAYDGIADLAFIAILSSNGKFGGVRAANANFFAGQGHTGIYAPGVEFNGPVYVGDITAFGDAKPVLRLGLASNVRVTGGDMQQANGEPVQVSGIAELRFTDGGDSHGRGLNAQPNRGVFEQDGTDVTAQIVVNPSPTDAGQAAQQSGSAVPPTGPPIATVPPDLPPVVPSLPTG